MAEKINLDALIPREDLETTTCMQRGRKKDTVSISDLLSDSYSYLIFISLIFREKLPNGIMKNR